MKKNIVYHYCDLNAFANIMKTKTVWLSDVKKSNDWNEGKYLLSSLLRYIEIAKMEEQNIDNEAIEYAKQLVLEHLEKRDSRMFIPHKYTYEKLTRENRRSKEVEDINEDVTLPDVDSEEYKKALKSAERMFRKIKKEQEENGVDILPGEEYYTDKFDSPLYTLCFSGEADLLSQWRGYADDGRGVAIGFKTKYLSDWNSWIFDPEYGYWSIANFNKVDYGSLTEDMFLKDAESKIITLARRILDKKNDDSAMAQIQECLHELVCRTAFVKDSAFKEEDEYRLIYNPLIKCDKGKYTIDVSIHEKIEREISNFKLSEMQYRVGKQGITTYHALSFGPIKDKIIGEIVLGPKCKMLTADIEYLLSMWGYNCKGENVYDQRSIYIHRSALTYR